MVAQPIEDEGFDIRNYQHLLEPSPKREKNKYVCPSCGGHNLSISPGSVKYDCYDCKDTSGIASILARQGRDGQQRQWTPSELPPPAPLPTNTPIATHPSIPTAIPTKKVKEKVKDFGEQSAIETRYTYSPTQHVRRLDFDNPAIDKDVRPWHIPKGKQAICKKGRKVWHPYRLDEVRKHGADKWVLVPEGEKAVEVARAKGLIATTFMGSCWGQKDLLRGVKAIADCGVAGIIILPDNDSTGEKKASDVAKAAAAVGLPCVQIPIESLWSDAGEGADIADWIAEEDLTPQEVASRIEVELERAIADSQHQEGEQTSFSLDELFSYKSEALDFIVPGLLPVGEAVILGGPPKSGKSMLAINLAFCVATGEGKFLGQVVKQGRVLLVSVDESIQSTQNKLLRRGFRAEGGMRVLTKFDLSQMALLEREIRDHRPDLVILDSLKRIAMGSKISENDAEFANVIYQMKEMFARYSAASVLIHHTNKSSDAVGVGQLRGTSAISGSVWGTWILSHILVKSPETPGKRIVDPRDPRRTFYAQCRDAEGEALKIEMSAENGSWEVVAAIESEANPEDKTLGDRIISIIQKNSERYPDGFTGSAIIELLGEHDRKRYVYMAISRLVNRRILSCSPSGKDSRANLYNFPKNREGDTPKDDRYLAETSTSQGIQDSDRTAIAQPQNSAHSTSREGADLGQSGNENSASEEGAIAIFGEDDRCAIAISNQDCEPVSGDSDRLPGTHPPCFEGELPQENCLTSQSEGDSADRDCSDSIALDEANELVNSARKPDLLEEADELASMVAAANGDPEALQAVLDVAGDIDVPPEEKRIIWNLLKSHYPSAADALRQARSRSDELRVNDRTSHQTEQDSDRLYNDFRFMVQDGIPIDILSSKLSSMGKSEKLIRDRLRKEFPEIAAQLNEFEQPSLDGLT